MWLNIENDVLKTGLYVKPTDMHQYLESFSCDLYHCKRGNPYSQHLRLIEIFSDNFFFWQEIQWLGRLAYKKRLWWKNVKEKKYYEQGHIHKSNYYKRSLWKRNNKNWHWALLIILFSRILLTPDNALKLVLDEIPTASFKNNKSLKDHLYRSVLPVPDKKGRSCKYHRNWCQDCNLIDETCTFSHSTTYETLKLTKGLVNCYFKCVLYLIWCKVYPLRFSYIKSAKNLGVP